VKNGCDTSVLLTAGISVVAIIATVVVSRWQISVYERANRLQESANKHQYFQTLRACADETCDTLSAACHICEEFPEAGDSSRWSKRQHTKSVCGYRH
jgi:type II secretory pathway pseudopilin PulG